MHTILAVLNLRDPPRPASTGTAPDPHEGNERLGRAARVERSLSRARELRQLRW